jgi:hypothetical protein
MELQSNFECICLISGGLGIGIPRESGDFPKRAGAGGGWHDDCEGDSAHINEIDWCETLDEPRRRMVKSSLLCREVDPIRLVAV